MKIPQLLGNVRRSTDSAQSLFAKKQKPVPNAGQARKELLALRPLRNPNLEWKEDEGRIVLLIKPPQLKNWKMRMMNLIFPLPIAPRDRHVVLDRIGTDVWNMIDGQTTFGQIAKSLATKYQLVPREAEMQLQQYFKELGRRGYIRFEGTPQRQNTKQAKKQ